MSAAYCPLGHSKATNKSVCHECSIFTLTKSMSLAEETRELRAKAENLMGER